MSEIDALIDMLQNPDPTFEPSVDTFYPKGSPAQVQLTNKQADRAKDELRAVPRNAVIAQLQRLVSQYNEDVTKDPSVVRMYVSNRLLEESAPTMPHAHRLKSLELLGKINGVDLFNERTEVTVKNAPVEDLKARLHKKLKTLLPEEYAQIVEGSS